MLGSKPATTPCEENHKLGSATGPLHSNPAMYRRLVGRLIYLCFTRPDLAYSVQVLSQFMQNTRSEHWQAALRVVRYLKGHPGQCILLPRENNLQLSGWCVSDWASCPLTRKSLTGWFIQLGTSPVSWKTQKQQIISASSTEAEYRSMAKTTRELKWIKEILTPFTFLILTQFVFTVIVKRRFTLQKTRSFTNAPNTLKLTAILFEMKLFTNIFYHHMCPHTRN